MKYLYTLATLLLFTLAAHAQKIEWKAMDTFHDLSNKTLHAAIAGDMQPLKQNSEQLLTDAIQWQKSAVPAQITTTKIKADLDEIVKQCTELNTAVKAGKPDNELKLLADKTHKTFHIILAECTINQ
jgi:hypothetical protein